MNNLSNFGSNENQSPFDAIRQIDEQGNEFWSARELMPLLGYKDYKRFEDAIQRAIASCENAQNPVTEHFRAEVSRKSGERGRPQENYKLSRYACYLTAMNGDPRKPEVAAAQTYFAIKARKAEVVEAIAPTTIDQVKPVRDAVDFIEAADKLAKLPEGLLKNLLKDALVDQVSLDQNLKYLPVAEKPKQYTIAKVRAKTLGYTDKQIGDGKQLGKFIKSQIEPAFQEMVGRYPVYHYEITPKLDATIQRFFT